MAFRSNSCSKGHSFTAKNTILRKSGQRQCRKCQRANNTRYRQRKRDEVNAPKNRGPYKKRTKQRMEPGLKELIVEKAKEWKECNGD